MCDLARSSQAFQETWIKKKRKQLSTAAFFISVPIMPFTLPSKLLHPESQFSVLSSLVDKKLHSLQGSCKLLMRHALFARSFEEIYSLQDIEEKLLPRKKLTFRGV